jgi:hypothetical protein
MEIHIQIKLAGDGFPSPDELDLRHELEDWLEDNGLGIVLDAGGGGGVMDIFFEQSLPDAKEQVEALMNQRGLSEIVTVRVVEG